MYSSGPIWGRIIDVRGPRISLAPGILLLLLGYSGIRYIFNAGVPASADTISTITISLLSLCGYMTGAGGRAGIAASVSSTANTFPDKAVRARFSLQFIFPPNHRLVPVCNGHWSRHIGFWILPLPVLDPPALVFRQEHISIPSLLLNRHRRSHDYRVLPHPSRPAQTPTLERGIESEDDSFLSEEGRGREIERVLELHCFTRALDSTRYFQSHAAHALQPTLQACRAKRGSPSQRIRFQPLPQHRLLADIQHLIVMHVLPVLYFYHSKAIRCPVAGTGVMCTLVPFS